MGNILAQGLVLALLLQSQIGCNESKPAEKECLAKIYLSLSDSFRAGALSDTLSYGYLVPEIKGPPKSKDTLWASSFHLFSPQNGWRTIKFKKDFFLLGECCQGQQTCLIPVVVIQSDGRASYPEAFDDLPKLFQEEVIAVKRREKAYLREPLIYQRFRDPEPKEKKHKKP